MNVHQIVMPTPYAVGPVNAYLIDAEPLTLIDAGINTPQAQNALLLGITDAGFFPQAIERIVVTHTHPDHYGLVHVIQELSGATVFVPEREIARIRDRQMLFEVGRLLLEAGMPLELLFKMDQARRDDPHRPRLKHDEVVLVRDGDTFEFKTETGEFLLESHLMPGHTGGHFVYLEPESRTLFAGDQLLPDISPNPLLEPSLDEPGERRRSLKEYLESLHKMAAMGLTLVYPGHGAPVNDPPSLIQGTIAHHEKRVGQVADRLGSEPKTPYEIAQAIYPNVRDYDAFLAVSEVVAHLDLVVDRGRATVSTTDGVTYYSSAS